MKVLDNIGLGLLVFSIVSVVFWSTRPYSISHDLDNAIEKISQKKEQMWEKAMNMPFKVDSASRNRINGIKEGIEDSENLYRNSLTRTNEETMKPTLNKFPNWIEDYSEKNYKNSLTQRNEENVKPTLNKISNWVGITKDPSTLEEHLNKAEEIKDASIEAGSHILYATNIASKNLKDTTYEKSTAIYDETSMILNYIIENKKIY